MHHMYKTQHSPNPIYEKRSLWLFENYTKPIKVYLQKAARPTANLFHFFRFLEEIMNSALQLS